jgi:hypothetical protein
MPQAVALATLITVMNIAFRVVAGSAAMVFWPTPAAPSETGDPGQGPKA